MQKFQQNVQNRQGDVIAGASVAVTVTSTNTPAALFSDNGVTSLTQPLTTDANGGFFFFAANGTYDVTVTGTTFAPIKWTAQILFDPDDADIPSSAALAGPSGASLVGFIQSFSGAVPRSTQDELRDRVSVKQAGAKGDGVTDDTAAFNRISGLTANIPAGEYILSSDVALNLDTKLIGAGGNATILHVFGELSWNSTGDMQTGEMTELTIIYHGINKPRIIGVNLVFDSFTQNRFLAHKFSIRPASGTDTAQVFFDVANPRQAIIRDFYVDGNFNSQIAPAGQVQETVIKTSGTGFGLYVDGFFARDVYRLAYQTGAVEGGHFGAGEVVGCYYGIESDASVPGGWISGPHINCVSRAVKYTNRSHCWISNLSAFRSQVFYQTDWAPIELTNCTIVNVLNLQGVCNPAGHTSRASGIIASGVTGLVVDGVQTVEVGKNGGALLELIGSTGADVRSCIGTACNQTVLSDAATNNCNIDITARTGTGTVTTASATVYVKDSAPSRTIAPFGTVSAPGLTFAGELDCGLYIPAANQLGIVVAGTEVHRHISAGGANRIESVSGGAGVAPRSRATGTDTDVDYEIGTKGAGAVKIGYGSVAASVPASFSATRYLRLKDSSGTIYYLPLSATVW